MADFKAPDGSDVFVGARLVDKSESGRVEIRWRGRVYFFAPGGEKQVELYSTPELFSTRGEATDRVAALAYQCKIGFDRESDFDHG